MRWSGVGRATVSLGNANGGPHLGQREVVMGGEGGFSADLTQMRARVGRVLPDAGLPEGVMLEKSMRRRVRKEREKNRAE